jgi:hypothetical protein
MSKIIEIEGDRIDWKDLYNQKEFLLNHGGEQAMGLAHFLDYIQDTAVNNGVYTEQAVFNHGDDDE